MSAAGDVERKEERLAVLTAAVRTFAEATTDRDALLRAVARSIAEVLGEPCVLLVMSDDGTKLAPRDVALGEPERASAISLAEDALRSRRAEARLEHLSAIVEATPDAIVISDSDDRITLVNEEAERLFGYARSEMMGQALAKLIPDFDALIGQRKDGAEFALDLTESTLRTDTGDFVVRSIRDITDRRNSELALVEAKEAAEAASRELDAFSYSVAHDLRAPLRSVHGFAEILLEEHGAQIGPDGEKLIRRITTSARKMGELVDGLLGLSRVTRMQAKRQTVDLSEIARTTLVQALEERAGTETDVQEGISAEVDPTLVRLLFDNLLANAVKFTAQTKQPVIQFGAENRDGERVFFIHDNGAGFDMEFSNKLFKPFERLHADAAFAGTGIGLATAKRIVERHGGRIWAEGAIDEGATFYFTLPTDG